MCHRLIKSLPHTERDSPNGNHAVLAQEIKGLVGLLTSDKQKECIALFVENSSYILLNSFFVDPSRLHLKKNLHFFWQFVNRHFFNFPSKLFFEGGRGVLRDCVNVLEYNLEI